MKNNIILLLYAHKGYLKPCNCEDFYDVLNERLFCAISNTYIPLLNLLSKLENQNIDAHIALSLSPTLCSLLSSEKLKTAYIDFLDRQIAFGHSEIQRLENSPEQKQQAQDTLQKIQKTKLDFVEVYQKNLIQEFTRHIKSGLVESLATCATYAFLPHLAYKKELLNAQIEAGLAAHKRYFGYLPEGFFLPHLGYTPQINEVLKSYNVNYTVLDSQSLLFSKDMVEKGIFYPVRSPEYLAFYARDFLACNKFYGKSAYKNLPPYLCVNKDVCYELDAKDLKTFIKDGQPRVASGYKYYCNGQEQNIAQDKNCNLYNKDLANEQAKKDAKDFVCFLEERLCQVQNITKSDTYSVVTLPESILGQDWAEGIEWLEAVIQEINLSKTLCFGTFAFGIAGTKQAALQKVDAYPAAICGSGYGEDMLDSTNFFIQRHLAKINERMVYIADKFSENTGLRARLLNLGAKEVLLAQSSDWPLMLHKNMLQDYCKRAFAQNITTFNKVFDALGSNQVDTDWLLNMEKQHSLFPWLNYKIFGPKR